jgi:hypothetical protein
MKMQTVPGPNETRTRGTGEIRSSASDVEAARAARAYSARAEINRLMSELHTLVARSERSVLDAIGAALPASAILQVATANVDACNPSRRPGIEADLTGLADQHLRSRRDAIERSLAYTADATMRRLHDA